MLHQLVIRLMKSASKWSYYCVYLFLIITFVQCKSNQYAMNHKTIKPNHFVQPEYLKPGDSIMIVSPSGFVSDSTGLDKGIELAESWGLNVILGKNVYNKHNHFAGTDQERLSDIQYALDNKNIKAIWCSRGGYGMVRIIDQIDFRVFKKNPKWVIGFSDITVLHEQIHNLGIASIHGTMPGGIKSASEDAKETLYKALFGYKYGFEIPNDSLNKNGFAKGILIGGNLTILQSMVGSESEVNFDNKIVFIEDVGEDLYRVDRMMQFFKRSGALKNIKGVIVGDFDYNIENNVLFGGTQREIIIEALKEYDFPVIFNFPAGHIKDNRALIFGKKITIDVNNKTSKINY